MSEKHLTELRELIRKDEDVREFFLLLKKPELRQQAIEKLNTHLSKK